MLGWRSLTTGQKIGAVFLVSIFLIAGPMFLIYSPSIAEKLKYLGALLIAFGIILNPAMFSQSSDSIISFSEMPLLCRILIGCGLAIVFLAWLLQYYP